MSDIIRTVVPKVSTLPNSASKIELIIKWLIKIDAIKPQLTDYTLSQKLGYAISDGAKKIVKEPEFLPFDLLSDGIGVAEGRRIFTNMEGGLDSIICPNCNNNIVNEDWEFFNSWHRGNDIVTCPLCNSLSNMLDFNLEPKWGFSNVGFQFNNWPELEPTFINEFEKRIDCKVEVIYSHI